MNKSFPRRNRWAAVAFTVGLATLAASALPKTARADGEQWGQGFLLGGSAQLALDPENAANEVIRITTLMNSASVGGLLSAPAPPPFGTISRVVDTQIQKLDNMLEFKAWFDTGKTCVGGSPRLQLAIDLNGDGTPEGNAFGYFGLGSTTTGCPPQTWLYEDLTGGGDTMAGPGPLPSTGRTTPNEEVEWDLTQFVCPAGTVPPGPSDAPCIAPVPFVTNWSAVETLISAFPKHLVCTVALVDDTFGAPGMSGTAYYDLFSAGRHTFTDRRDIVGRGFAKGCQRLDDDDNNHWDDDHDKDRDRDDDDDEYDRKRKERWGDRDN
jgi:hypothetical protein